MLANILHHPRRLWIRRPLFQVHLWAGILLALYIAVIGLSGSILVFQDELRLHALPHPPFSPTPIANLDTVAEQAQKLFPQWRLIYVAVPQKNTPWWTLYLENARGQRKLAYADPSSGSLLTPRRRLFIDWVLYLHVYLLAGRTGFVVNCLAGIGLLLLALTGVFLWWPGIRLWPRALIVSLRHRWRRMNYDLHNAIGIWMLLLVSWWGITAIYFLMPAKITAMLNALSPLEGMKPPATAQPAGNAPEMPVSALVATLAPRQREHLDGIGLPQAGGGGLTVYIDRRNPGDFSHRDILTLDAHTGKVLSLWHYGENHSLGDWLLWLMEPLHFGTLWGLPVKILWSLCGLSLPVLSITGLLMYWNRSLRFKLRPQSR